MGADLFESYVGAIVSAVTLGVFFCRAWFAIPLLLTLGIAASILGTFFVRGKEEANPHKALKMASYVSSAIVTVGALLLSWWRSTTSCFRFPVIAGLAVGVAIGFVTELYTSSDYKSVKNIAEKSLTGPAINIVSGLSVGMLSTLVPILLVCVGVLVAYLTGGMYGIAPRPLARSPPRVLRWRWMHMDRSRIMRAASLKWQTWIAPSVILPTSSIP